MSATPPVTASKRPVSVPVLRDRRIAARNAGQLHYNGVPCRHGHNGGRYVASNACVECAAMARKACRLRVPNKALRQTNRDSLGRPAHPSHRRVLAKHARDVCSTVSSVRRGAYDDLEPDRRSSLKPAERAPSRRSNRANIRTETHSKPAEIKDAATRTPTYLDLLLPQKLLATWGRPCS
jgi:hypothetical protein